MNSTNGYHKQKNQAPIMVYQTNPLRVLGLAMVLLSVIALHFLPSVASASSSIFYHH
jgi:hypothetical protein